MALLELEHLDLFEQTLELFTSEYALKTLPTFWGQPWHTEIMATWLGKYCDRWEELNKKFPQNSIPRMVGGIRSLSTPVIAEEIRASLHNIRSLKVSSRSSSI